MLLPVEVIADVGNVRVEVGETALRESEVRNTSAKAGAGTGIEQVLADWSHCTVVTFSVPFKRPSDCNIGPNDCEREIVMSGNGEGEVWVNALTCPAQVKLFTDATESARRYL